MSHMPVTEQPEGATAVPDTRTISTTAPITGGGDLSANRTIALADGGVTLAKLANVATARIIGRVTGGTGVPEAMTGTQATTLLDAFTSGLKGLAPASGGGSTNYLRADGAWSAPPGSSTDTRDIFNVVDYGADLTGSADSTTAVRNAVTAAAANVTSTSRRSTILFPAGVFSLRTKDAIRVINLAGKTKLVFQGATGRRTRLLQNGSAASGDWHMFQIQTGSSDIEFRDLVLDQSGLTNPDPAEQNHLVELGNGATDVRFYDCEFYDTVGDGIRIRGEFGEQTSNIDIQRCRFIECGRSGIGFQRFTRAVSIIGCTFTEGTDQQVDFEPTGYQLVASASGGSTTVINRTGSLFQTWGIAAGDLVYNQTDRVLTEIVSVDSETQLTTRTMPNSWNSASFWFPRTCSGHVIVGNKFLRSGTANADNLVTLTGSMDTVFADNYVEGCIQFEHTINLRIAGNRMISRKTSVSSPVIQSIKTAIGLQIIGNSLWARADAVTTERNVISITDQGGDMPTSALIEGNRIQIDTRAIGINLESIKRVTVRDNDITINTPGDTGSGGINIRATSGVIEFAEVVGNKIVTMGSSGIPSYAIQFSVNAYDINTCIIGGGYIDGINNPLVFGTGAGVFTSPPIITGWPSGSGSSPLVPSSETPWFQLAGVGGDATASAYKPGLFWGDASPESVLTAPIGSIAMRRDGSGATATYVKGSGTSNTGWIPIAGAVATGTIVCVAKASLVDTEIVTIGDGISPAKVYEFDVAGDGVTAGRVQVNVSTDTTATQVADRLKTAIEANQPLLSVVNTTGSLALTHKIAGTFANITITEGVANGSFTVSGMSGGVNPAR